MDREDRIQVEHETPADLLDELYSGEIYSMEDAGDGRMSPLTGAGFGRRVYFWIESSVD